MSVAFEQLLRDHYDREDPKNIPEAVRQAVLHRDLAQCQLCGTSGENRLQLHHVLYRSQGGRHLEHNLVTLCFRCHGDVHAGRQDVRLVEVEPGLWRAFPAAAIRNSYYPKRSPHS